MRKRTYTLDPNDMVLQHHSSRHLALLHDYQESGTARQIEIDALVASGDCFVTLATNADDIADVLADQGVTQVIPQLEALTQTLLYLQRHYKISRKAANFRQ